MDLLVGSQNVVLTVTMQQTDRVVWCTVCTQLCWIFCTFACNIHCNVYITCVNTLHIECTIMCHLSFASSREWGGRMLTYSNPKRCYCKCPSIETEQSLKSNYLSRTKMLLHSRASQYLHLIKVTSHTILVPTCALPWHGWIQQSMHARTVYHLVITVSVQYGTVCCIVWYFLGFVQTV